MIPDPAEEIGMVIARVIVSRVLTDDDGIVDQVVAQTADGDELGLAEALGMMRLAEDTLIRARFDEGTVNE